MNGFGKRTTALLGFGMLLGFYAPAWSADSATPAANSQTMPANPHNSSLLGMLSSVLSDAPTGARKSRNQRRPSQLYSQHDVVGDPETCFMGRYTIGGGTNATGPAGIP